MNSCRPPSQRSRCASAAAGSFCSSASAASRACSISATSRSRSAKRSSGTPDWRAPRNSPGPRIRRSCARDLEAVGALVDHLEPRLGGIGQRLLEQQDAHALRGAAADAPAQLVQLREAEALGVLDHHQRRVGHVDADLDHRRRDQHARSCRATKSAITSALSSGFIRPCSSPTASAGPSAASELRVQRDGRLQLELLRFLDQRAYPVRLPAFGARLARRARRSRRGAGC